MRMAGWALCAAVIGTAGVAGAQEKVASLDEAPAGPVLTLDDVLKRAEEGAPTLDALRARLEESNASTAEAWRALYPSLGVQASFTRYNFDDVTFPSPETGDLFVVQPQNELKASARLEIPLLAPPLWYAAGAADSGQEAAEASIRDSRQAYFLGISQAYFFAVGSKRAVEVRRAQLETTREQERVAKAQFEVGDQPKIALLKASGDRAQAEQELRGALNSYATARNSLRRLAGITDDFEVEQPVDVQAPAAASDELIREASANRSDLVAANATVDARASGLTASRWSLAPIITGAVAVSVQNYAGFGGETVYLGQVVAQWNLLDFTAWSRINRSNAQLAQAEADRADLLLKIEEEVRTAQLDLETSRANLISAQEQERTAVENLRLTEAQRDAGTATYLEVSTATRDRTGAGIAVIREELNTQVAALKLIRALGKFRD